VDVTYLRDQGYGEIPTRQERQNSNNLMGVYREYSSESRVMKKKLRENVMEMNDLILGARRNRAQGTSTGEAQILDWSKSRRPGPLVVRP
jgi:hypothetical protein